MHEIPLLMEAKLIEELHVYTPVAILIFVILYIVMLYTLKGIIRHANFCSCWHLSKQFYDSNMFDVYVSQ